MASAPAWKAASIRRSASSTAALVGRTDVRHDEARLALAERAGCPGRASPTFIGPPPCPRGLAQPSRDGSGVRPGLPARVARGWGPPSARSASSGGAAPRRRATAETPARAQAVEERRAGRRGAGTHQQGHRAAGPRPRSSTAVSSRRTATGRRPRRSASRSRAARSAKPTPRCDVRLGESRRAPQPRELGAQEVLRLRDRSPRAARLPARQLGEGHDDGAAARDPRRSTGSSGRGRGAPPRPRRGRGAAPRPSAPPGSRTAGRGRPWARAATRVGERTPQAARGRRERAAGSGRPRPARDRGRGRRARCRPGRGAACRRAGARVRPPRRGPGVEETHRRSRPCARSAGRPSRRAGTSPRSTGERPRATPRSSRKLAPSSERQPAPHPRPGSRGPVRGGARPSGPSSSSTVRKGTPSRSREDVRRARPGHDERTLALPGAEPDPASPRPRRPARSRSQSWPGPPPASRFRGRKP